MKVKSGIVIALVTIAALALAACGSATSGPAASSMMASAEGNPWMLASYVNAEGKTVDVPAGTEITALFEQGRVTGSGGCNRYAGVYTVTGQNVKMEVGGATMMYCPPEEVMAAEAAYLAAMDRVATYKVSGDQLQLAGEDGGVVLTYSVLQPKALVGTIWGMTAYNNGTGGLTTPLAGRNVTALFGAEGDMAGNAGCNVYTAAYQVDGTNISIGQSTATTMACAQPEGILEQEAAYLAALQTVTQYQIEGDQLVLLNAEGAKAAVFAARADAYARALALLGNAEYQTEWTESGVVTLEDGEYRAPAAPGSASELVIEMTEYVAAGKLKDQATGSEQLGAAVILTSSGGGTGTFYELHAMVIRDGQFYDVAWTQLGDGVQINSLAIVNGEILVDMITHGPQDAACCPTQPVVQTYALNGEELVLTSK